MLNIHLVEYFPNKIEELNLKNKFLLSGKKSLPKSYLKFTFGFTFSTCGLFPKKTKQEYKNSMKQNTPDTSMGKETKKACFQHDMAYG